MGRAIDRHDKGVEEHSKIVDKVAIAEKKAKELGIDLNSEVLNNGVTDT